jgi:hypothetical protein
VPRNGINFEQPNRCPVCRDPSIQQITRTRFVIFAEAKPQASDVMAYRCAKGHIFLPGTFPVQDRDAEPQQLTEREKKLKGALKSLFELLEEYSPRWYTKEHHDQAVAALEY